MLKKIIQLALIGILGFLLLFPSVTIYAQDPEPYPFIVNSTLDLPDFANNSVCSAGSAADGPCTLRAAIDEANKCPDDPGACEGGAVIYVPPGTYNLSLAGANENENVTGDLDINAWYGIQIIIEGDPINPPVINANGIDRVFHILNNTANSLVELRYLVIQGGHLEVNTPASQNYQYGGGISNYGNLWLTNVVLQDNQLTCISTLDMNCYQAIGGGLYNFGTLLMNNSTIRNNQARRGAGIFQSSSDSSASILNSTVSGNLAGESGGGIESYGNLSVYNSTISNNSAPFYGGIGNEGSGVLTLMNVTVASNTSTSSNAANLDNHADLTIMNSVIAYPGNLPTAVNCFNSGGWTMYGGNLYSDGSCIAGPGVVSSTDPRLSPLAWLGGPTMTRGLLKGSPAHDATGGNCLNFTGGAVTFDQRGSNRDNQCDLGAFEGVAYSIYLPAVKH